MLALVRASALRDFCGPGRFGEEDRCAGAIDHEAALRRRSGLISITEEGV